jgi:hypothetical protein
MNEEEREQEEQSPRRPRVIDKRISARPPQDKSSAEPSQPPGGDTAAPSAEAGAAPPSGAAAASSTAVEADRSPDGGPPPVTGSPLTEPNEGQAPPPSVAAAPGERVWTPEQEAEAARMAQEIADTPSFEWVVNTAVTLANVAATKLELGSGGDAQLAIDALAGLLNSVGSRLQQAESPLRQTLAQLQLAYAERLSAPPP